MTTVAGSVRSAVNSSLALVTTSAGAIVSTVNAAGTIVTALNDSASVVAARLRKNAAKDMLVMDQLIHDQAITEIAEHKAEMETLLNNNPTFAKHFQNVHSEFSTDIMTAIKAV